MIGVHPAAALLSVLLASPVLAGEVGESTEPPRRPYVALDLSLGLGSGDSMGDPERQLSFGLHLTARPGPIVLAGNLEGATNFFGSVHGFFTMGAGAWLQMARGRLVLLGLYGIHALEGVRFVGTSEEHKLRTVGARAAWEFDAGRWVMGRASLAASGYVDLDREFDSEVGGDVGGVTVLLSLALGLGL